jgi:8-oxo-dGTP pyrophosphatase MutT (NUDIX family)
MPIEKSAGIVIFRKESGKNYYLLLHYPSRQKRGAKSDYWDLPKGHIEKGETLEETAKREVKEETGINDIEMIPGFGETVKYFFNAEGKNILKFVTFFLAETKTKNVVISNEHLGYRWLPIKEAEEKIMFKNAKNIIKKADRIVSGKSLREDKKN